MNTHMLSFLLLLFFSTSKLSLGFVQLEVISPASYNTPIYPDPSYFWDVIKVSVQQSNDRELYHSSMAKNSTRQSVLENKVNEPRSLLVQSSAQYAVSIAKGTRPTATWYSLALDTASNIIWVQCNECTQNGNSCFPQSSVPFFECDKDHDCYPLNCTNNKQICRHKGRCKGSQCRYTQRFYDHSKTSGYFARGKFIFECSFGYADALVEDLDFGCGTNQVGFKFDPDSHIAGIMGMSRAPTSLPSQLEAGLFSHCFPSEVNQWDELVSCMSFGSEIQTDAYYTAQLHDDDDHKMMYTVLLTDISINDGPRVSVGNALAIIDTGTHLTRLGTGVYDTLESRLVDHFSNLGNIVSRIEYQDLLCYKWENKPENPYGDLPYIKFTLGTAVFEIHPEDAFFVNKGDHRQFCLWMKRGRTDTTLIGARALTNQRIVYDPQGMQIHFAPEIC